MNDPGVTVVITYHNEDHKILDRAWRSVLNQTVVPHETIIVDDGSDPPLQMFFHPLAKTKVVRVTNRGLPAARNTGLMLCKTEAILFLDSDDWLDPTYIEKTLPLLENADVVLTGLQEHGPTRNGTYMPGYNKHWSLVTIEDLWRTNLFYYCSLMRTELLREIGGYNTLMAGAWNQNGGLEDWDLTLDLMTRGARYAAVEEVLFHYDTSNPNSMIHRSQPNRDALHAEMRRHHGLT